MPSQLAPALYQAKSPTRVAELLRAETERIMADLKREMADYLAAKEKAEVVVDADDGDGA